MKSFAICILSITLNWGYAQEMSPTNLTTQSPVRRAAPGAEPDLPGTFTMNFGFNFLDGAPDDMDLRFWPSKGVSFYYLYDMPIGESKFSFHPGFGVAFESYAFEQNVTVDYPIGADSAQIVSLDPEQYETVDKSKLVTHYVDVPLEFRFYTKENQRGFMVALGGKVGYLFSSYTKIAYENDGREFTDKSRRDLNLSRIRYGVHARLGFRGIHLHGQYMFSDLFKSDGGPQTNNYKIGLSFALF